MAQSHEAGTEVPEYLYEPLPRGQFIRMLTLHPGAPDDPLRGELEFFDLDRPSDESNDILDRQYEPVSYVWGAPDRSHEIICNGQRLAVTSSIHGALQRLRHLDRPRRVWVDQISINQRDLAERSQQVQFMNTIYKNASHVLVWLGPDQNNMAAQAFKLVSKLQEIFHDEEKSRQFGVDPIRLLETQSEDPWVPLRALTALPWVSMHPDDCMVQHWWPISTSC